MPRNSPIYNLSVDHRGWSSEDWSNEPSVGFVVAKRITLRESGELSANVNLPPGAVIIDVPFLHEAAWDDGTSAALNVGLFDTGGTVIDVDVIWAAVPLDAALGPTPGRFNTFDSNEGFTSGYLSSVHAATIVNDGAQVRATVTVGTGDGTAGILHVDVLYYVPNTRDLG